MIVYNTIRQKIPACVKIDLGRGFELSLSTIFMRSCLAVFYKRIGAPECVKQIEVTDIIFDGDREPLPTAENISKAILFAQNSTRTH